MTWVKWNLVSVHFEVVLISTQDRCTRCAERAIVSEVMLGAPDGTPRLHGVKWRLVLVRLEIV